MSRAGWFAVRAMPPRGGLVVTFKIRARSIVDAMQRVDERWSPELRAFAGRRFRSARG